MKDYKEIAKEARKKVLELVYKAQTSHIGSNMSCVDILTVLFEKVDTEKDEVVLSAGWKAASWYYFLFRKGIISEEELNSFCQPGSPFIGLVEPQECTICRRCSEGVLDCKGITCGCNVRLNIKFCKRCNGSGKRWGLKCAGGSMGLSLPSAVGLALAKKLKGEEGKVYVLLSDGECQIGTFYESLLIAKQHNLSNLIVLIDNNKFCAMGRTKDILDIEPLEHKIVSFGWNVVKVNGHNFNQIAKEGLNFHEWIQKGNLMPRNAWIASSDRSETKNYPLCILANTIKGKGISWMENNNDWHYRNIDKESYELATKELGQ